MLARDLPLETTSSVAAALWYPYRAYPVERVLGWATTTYADLAALAEDETTGVTMRRGTQVLRSPEARPWWAAAVPSLEAATALPRGVRRRLVRRGAGRGDAGLPRLAEHPGGGARRHRHPDGALRPCRTRPRWSSTPAASGAGCWGPTTRSCRCAARSWWSSRSASRSGGSTAPVRRTSCRAAATSSWAAPTRRGPGTAGPTRTWRARSWPARPRWCPQLAAREGPAPPGRAATGAPGGAAGGADRGARQPGHPLLRPRGSRRHVVVGLRRRGDRARGLIGPRRHPASRRFAPMDVRRLVLLALPGLSLGIVGATHPGSLSYPTSHHWWQMHLAGMFVFPLVGVALAALVWGRRDPLALVVLAGAFVYARLLHRPRRHQRADRRLGDLPARARTAAARRGRLHLPDRRPGGRRRRVGPARRRRCRLDRGGAPDRVARARGRRAAAARDVVGARGPHLPAVRRRRGRAHRARAPRAWPGRRAARPGTTRSPTPERPPALARLPSAGFWSLPARKAGLWALAAAGTAYDVQPADQNPARRGA